MKNLKECIFVQKLTTCMYLEFCYKNSLKNKINCDYICFTCTHSIGIPDLDICVLDM